MLKVKTILDRVGGFLPRPRKEVRVKDLYKPVFLHVPNEIFDKIVKDGTPKDVIMQLILDKYDK
jgi:hypothetical protein